MVTQRRGSSSSQWIAQHGQWWRLTGARLDRYNDWDGSRPCGIGCRCETRHGQAWSGTHLDQRRQSNSSVKTGATKQMHRSSARQCGAVVGAKPRQGRQHIEASIKAAPQHGEDLGHWKQAQIAGWTRRQRNGLAGGELGAQLNSTNGAGTRDQHTAPMDHQGIASGQGLARVGKSNDGDGGQWGGSFRRGLSAELSSSLSLISRFFSLGELWERSFLIVKNVHII